MNEGTCSFFYRIKKEHVPFFQAVQKAMESWRGPQPSRTTIAPGGVYGGRGRMFAAENSIFQSKHPYIAIFVPGNLNDFSKNW